MKKNSIHIIPAAEIDSFKWNEKISNEKNGLIYSTTTYLNTITDNWCGLVVNDYEVIVAVPFRKKGFIQYSYTPNFIQQLGLIGTYNKAIANDIITTIKKKFRYGSLQFNFLNTPSIFLDTYNEKINFTLSLNRPYEEIVKRFRKDLKLNLEKCKSQLLDYIKTTDCNTAIELYQAQYGHKLNNVSNNDYHKLTLFCSKNIKNKEECFTRTIINEEHEILAVALIFKDEKRLYNIANTVTPKGRALFANHLLLSYIIAEFSEQDLLFDFEGSVIPGIKEFYSGFGPSEETYATYHYNNLPFPLSIFS